MPLVIHDPPVLFNSRIFKIFTLHTILDRRLTPVYQVSRRRPVGHLPGLLKITTSGVIVDRRSGLPAFHSSNPSEQSIVSLSLPTDKTVPEASNSRPECNLECVPPDLAGPPKKCLKFSDVPAGSAIGANSASGVGGSEQSTRPTLILFRVVRRRGQRLSTVPTTKVAGTRWLGGWPLLGTRAPVLRFIGDILPVCLLL